MDIEILPNSYNWVVNQEIIDRLIEINNKFYRDFAGQFSSTRTRVQPGIKRIIAQLPENATVLDIGCGNGELYLELFRNGFKGNYIGLDFSDEMVSIAKKRCRTALDNHGMGKENKFNNPIFLVRDITNPNWSLDLPSKFFNFIFAFSVLHHIPGMGVRITLLRNTRKQLHENGLLSLSVWQFLNSPKLRKRIIPWKEVGLDSNIVDPLDYLLDWKHEGFGLRYVHHYSRAELEFLAIETGYSILKTFISDGEGGNLGLYQIWGKNVIRNSIV